MPERESDIVTAICDYLAYRPGILFWRQNTAPTFDTTKKTFRRMPAYALKGVPDIIVIKHGQFIGLEVKTKKGTQSPEQREFEHRVTLVGGAYAVVRSIDDVQALGL